MKNILLLCLSLLLFSCEKDPDPGFRISKNATVKIKPASNLKSASTQHLTDKEIVEQCVLISFYNIPTFGNQDTNIGFSESQRDVTSNPPYLKRWATDLINVDGFGKYYLVPDLIYATDLVYCRALPNNVRDTIAYTPNATMRKMELDIKASLAANDTIQAYEVFNNGMRFTPITGAEWRALKAQNLQ